MRVHKMLQSMDEARFLERKRRQAEQSADRRRRRKSALTLLATQDSVKAEQVVQEERTKNSANRRAQRARDKRPTWRQASRLLERLESEAKVPRLSTNQHRHKDNAVSSIKQRALKFGSIRPPMVEDFVAELKIKRGQRFVDVGSGLGTVCMLLSMVVGIETYGIEIRQELHEQALAISERVQQECLRRRWFGVGQWTLICGDARQVLLDKSMLNDEEEISSSIDRCLYSTADFLLLNNWAFDDLLTDELLSNYGRLAPIDGRVILLRNPTPRYRPDSSRGNEPLALFELPTSEAQIVSVPRDGIDWRHHRDVHWTWLRVLPLGVRQLDRLGLTDQRVAKAAMRKFRKMSQSLLV